MHFMLRSKSSGRERINLSEFEIQTIRIGGLDRRLADTARILKQYANGELACIEELEETYQPFCYFEKNNIEELNYNLWSDIVSPSVIG